MPRRLAINGDRRLCVTEHALRFLPGYVRDLRTVGCRRAADALARALKSIEGARRHARRCARAQAHA